MCIALIISCHSSDAKENSEARGSWDYRGGFTPDSLATDRGVRGAAATVWAIEPSSTIVIAE
jgi:hypothetical protein